MKNTEKMLYKGEFLWVARVVSCERLQFLIQFSFVAIFNSFFFQPRKCEWKNKESNSLNLSTIPLLLH